MNIPAGSEGPLLISLYFFRYLLIVFLASFTGSDIVSRIFSCASLMAPIYDLAPFFKSNLSGISLSTLCLKPEFSFKVFFSA